MSYVYKVDIAGETYGMNDIESASIYQPLFENVSIGNASAAELTISFWPKSEIPTMAEIRPYVREESESEWKPLGIFYIDTRTIRNSHMEIVAYDAMLKSGVVWKPDQSLEFPMTMKSAAEVIAQTMGVTIDPRTKLTVTQEQVDYPDDTTTMRKVLQDIAAAHHGNWIMTDKGQLLLIPLFDSVPPETFYLIEEHGDAITFGGDRILV